MSKQELEIEERWKQMTLSQKASDWVSRHEYSFILGGWALSLAIAGGIIWRDKYAAPYSLPPHCFLINLAPYRYQTAPQKIVQARMWAQGLTIGVLIAGGALSHSRRQAAAEAGKVSLLHHSLSNPFHILTHHSRAVVRTARPLMGGCPRTKRAPGT
jgi:hypothetical protein